MIWIWSSQTLKLKRPLLTVVDSTAGEVKEGQLRLFEDQCTKYVKNKYIHKCVLQVP
jgi:hypothetical protein